MPLHQDLYVVHRVVQLRGSSLNHLRLLLENNAWGHRCASSFLILRHNIGHAHGTIHEACLFCRVGYTPWIHIAFCDVWNVELVHFSPNSLHVQFKTCCCSWFQNWNFRVEITKLGFQSLESRMNSSKNGSKPFTDAETRGSWYFSMTFCNLVVFWGGSCKIKVTDFEFFTIYNGIFKQLLASCCTCNAHKLFALQLRGWKLNMLHLTFPKIGFRNLDIRIRTSEFGVQSLNFTV